MSMAINLIQVLLPDSLTILSASLPSGKEIESTAGDLVYSLLSDPVNAASLYGVFGTHYNPASVVDNAEQDTTSTWWLDTSRMPWGIQTVEVVPANKEWHQNELDHLGEGLLPLTTPIFPFLHALLTPRADGTLKLSHQPFYAAAQGNMASPPKSGFSDFTLSSHLHTPRLRLVCGAPGLSVRLKFAHVPEIYDGWEGRVFFLPASWDGIGPATGTGTRVSEVVEAVCEELGIRRVVLQGSKSARVEYALADVTTEQISMPPPPPLNGQLCLPEHLLHLSGNPQAYPKLYFTISAKWLNRLGTVALGFSKHARKNLDRTRVTGRKSTGEARPKQVSSEKFVSPKPAGMFGLWGEANASKAIAPLLTPLTTGDKELDDLANESLGSEEEDAELNGTLKGATTASREEADQSASEIPGRKKASNSHTTTARLSKMFEGWIGSAAEGNVDTSPGLSQPSFPSQGTRNQARVDRPKSRVISSPISAQKDWSTSSDSGDENLEEQFELLMQDMGIKGNSRAAMLALSDDRKRFLIAQNDAAKSTPSRARIRSAQGTGSGASPSPDSSGGLADTLSRAGTAFAWGNRFSIASIAGWSGEEPATVTSSPLPSSSTRESCTPSSGETSVGTDSEVSEAIKSNATGASAGGIWSSWWGGSGDAVEKGDPAYYPRLLLAGRLSRKDLVKTLLSLRVTLSSSKLVWISGFLDERGLDALERTLQVETQPFVGDQATVERKEMADVILSESVKCLRTLMNTEPGFDRVLQQPHLINCITYSLKAPSFKVRSQVADLLGAMCVLSSENGHRLVCSALSELRVAAKQRYRFAFLVDSLSLEAAARDSLTSTTTSEEEVDEAAIWEYRTSALVLINALANGPEDLEERIGIREEFSKRGLNEVVVALGYADPPDGVLTQIQVYNEERQDDLDELHERALAVTTNIEQPFGEAGVILQRIESDFYSRVVDVLKACSQIVARDVDHQFRSELFFLIEKFVVNCAGMSDFDESWRRSTRLYLASVEHIVGKQAMIKASRISDTSTVPSSFVEELEGLRQKVEELSDDKQRLKAELKDTIAQTNTLRSLPEANAILKRKSLHDTFAGNQRSGTENENFGGVIQRLIQKEKQVLELQAELDRLTGSSAVTSLEEEEERAKRERQERSRQWSNLMDEIAKLKERLAEGEAVLESREREIRYLKRALEAVYSRFQSSVGVIPAPNVRQANTSSDPQQDLSAVQASSIDADTIAEKTIEALGDRDAEIASLRSDVAKLQDQMIRASQAQSKSEEDLRSSHAGVLAEQQAREEALKETISDLQSRMAQLQAQQGPQIRLPASVDASALLPPPPPPPPPTPSVASVSVGPSLLTRSDPASGAAPPPPPPPPIFSSVLMANGLTPAPPRPPTPPGMADPPPPPPPPPAFAGVPLPPPPPPAMLQMPNIPEKRRKPLFWSKLPVSVVVKTVWNDLPNDQINVRLDDLDKIFAIQNTAVEARKPGMSEAKKGSHTTVLDLQRAQNIAIMLSRVKLSFTQIRQALLEVESAHLTLETLKVIRNCLPNNEEAELIREYQGDFALLSKADQFCKEIVGIPKLKSRVDCMIYMKKFELDLEELKPDLRILQQAVSEVNSSKKFKLILKNILMLGNILNNKTFRGEARGFVLSDLLKLRDTRAAIAPGHKGVIVTPTLLHYLVQVLNQEDPALVGFLDDWRHVEAAARVSTTSVASGVTAMVNGMTMIQVEVKTLRQMCIMSTNDKFVPMCDGFLKESAPQVEMLKKSSEQISKELSKMMEYFGETDKNAKPEDFFSLLGSFGQSLMQAELEVRDNEARAQREKSKGATANRFLLKLDTPAPLVVTTTLLKSLNEDDEGEGGKTKKEEDKISPPGATAVHAVNPVPEEEEEEEEEVTTPLAMASCNSRGTTRGSLRFRSWGQSAVATLPEEVEGTEDLQQTTIGRKARVGGVRGQLDEAIKELRMGGPNNGRKSLRRQDTRTAHRPLSRVFLDT